MASIRKQESGHWRVWVRRKGKSLTETFVNREDAKTWGLDAERQIDRGGSPLPSRVSRITKFRDLIKLHIADMTEVGKPPGRSKAATLEMLKRELGAKSVVDLDRNELVKFGRARAAQGAGPVTLSMDIGAIKLVVSHAAAVHGLDVSVEQINLARIALKRLGLIGKSNERDRRPTDEELEKLFRHFDMNERYTIPMSRVIRFAIATAMRQEEIFRATCASPANCATGLPSATDRTRERIGNCRSSVSPPSSL